MNQKCVHRHRVGGIAPFSLESFQSARLEGDDRSRPACRKATSGRAIEGTTTTSFGERTEDERCVGVLSYVLD